VFEALHDSLILKMFGLAVFLGAALEPVSRDLRVADRSQIWTLT
jgi:hypothetical protein